MKTAKAEGGTGWSHSASSQQIDFTGLWLKLTSWQERLTHIEGNHPYQWLQKDALGRPTNRFSVLRYQNLGGKTALWRAMGRCTIWLKILYSLPVFWICMSQESVLYWIWWIWIKISISIMPCECKMFVAQKSPFGDASTHLLSCRYKCFTMEHQSQEL